MRPTFNSENIQLAAALVCIVLTGLIPDLTGSGYWAYSFQFVNVLIVVAVAQNFLPTTPTRSRSDRVRFLAPGPM